MELKAPINCGTKNIYFEKYSTPLNKIKVITNIRSARKTLETRLFLFCVSTTKLRKIPCRTPNNPITENMSNEGVINIY
jgi:hypothetical protein